MSRFTAIMAAQYRKATSEPNEYIKFALKSDTEPNIWYILLSGFDGDEDEFRGGEYLVRMEAPPKFPASSILPGWRERPRETAAQFVRP